MNDNQVKIYGQMFTELGLTELKVVDKDFQLELKKEVTVVNSVPCDMGNLSANTNVATNGNVVANPTVLNINDKMNSEEITSNEDNNSNNTTEVKAPLVGVFYSAPSPNDENFVKLGDKVSKGDVVCVIEAMKMFNEIKADVSGTISEICVNNGNIVEYGQPLFKITVE